MSLTYIKICGITNLADAYAATEAGADMLGFIFYPPSPRSISPAQAGEIAWLIAQEFGTSRPRFVGVFVDMPVFKVQRAAELAHLDLIQLHGNEPPDNLLDLAGRAFKALRPRTLAETLAGWETYRPTFVADPDTPNLLIDAYDPARPGGSGRPADWELAQTLTQRCRLLLAGGLTPDNAAWAVQQVQPWGIDVSSGVEMSKGKKDHGRVRAFIQAVREASRTLERENTVILTAAGKMTAL